MKEVQLSEICMNVVWLKVKRKSVISLTLLFLVLKHFWSICYFPIISHWTRKSRGFKLSRFSILCLKHRGFSFAKFIISDFSKMICLYHVALAIMTKCLRRIIFRFEIEVVDNDRLPLFFWYLDTSPWHHHCYQLYFSPCAFRIWQSRNGVALTV